MGPKALYDISVFRSDFTAELEVMLDMLRVLGKNPCYPFANMRKLIIKARQELTDYQHIFRGNE